MPATASEARTGTGPTAVRQWPWRGPLAGILFVSFSRVISAFQALPSELQGLEVWLQSRLRGKGAEILIVSKTLTTRSSLTCSSKSQCICEHAIEYMDFWEGLDRHKDANQEVSSNGLGPWAFALRGFEELRTLDLLCRGSFRNCGREWNLGSKAFAQNFVLNPENTSDYSRYNLNRNIQSQAVSNPL